VTIEYTGRQTEVGPKIRTVVERRLKKLTKVLHHISRVHVILSADKHRQIAEVSVHSPNLSLTATEESTDMASSVAKVMDRIDRQAQRRVGRLRERKRRAPGRGSALWSGVVSSGVEGARIVRSRRIPIEPMSVEQAVGAMAAADDSFLVFRDTASERVNLVYRLPDGSLGLLEPEI
jgi:putative sigma-54 modulation protein